MITVERIRQFLAYHPGSGELRWVAKPNRNIVVGSVAGRTNSDGYIRVGLDGKAHPAHRLAWMLAYGEAPSGHVDHINGGRADNRLCNLRDVPARVNCQNLRKPTARNKAGLLGASWSQRTGRWVASIKLDGKSTFLGYFDSAEQAHASYLDAKRKIHAGCTL